MHRSLCVRFARRSVRGCSKITYPFAHTNGTGSELRFTGRRTDPETGLQLNRNRFYASHLGRWVNRDPIGYDGGTWNLYEYVNGMPLDGVDPSGEVRGKVFALHCTCLPPNPPNASIAIGHWVSLSPRCTRDCRERNGLAACTACCGKCPGPISLSACLCATYSFKMLFNCGCLVTGCL